MANKKPTIVGVNQDGGTDSDNNNPATEHYVVVVGSGVDFVGRTYYRFFDPGTSRSAAGTSPENKLFLDLGNNNLSGYSEYNEASYTVTEVRP